MLAQTTRIVQQSFIEVSQQVPDLAAIFRRELLALDAGLHTLFPDPSDGPGEPLMDMFATAVRLAHRPRLLRLALRHWGQRYAGRGVQPRHYDIVGLALMRTLELCLRESWTEEVRVAWMKFYRRAATMIMDAADEAAQAA